MSKQITQNLSICEAAITQKHQLEIGWLGLCGMLKNIRDNELYKGRWESFEDFLQDPQMGLDKASASKMITIHEKFIIEYKMSPARIANAGGWSKIAEVLPAVKNKKSAEEWVDKCSSLSKSDLRKEVKEHATGIKMSECLHSDFYTVKICRGCGARIEQK